MQQEAKPVTEKEQEKAAIDHAGSIPEDDTVTHSQRVVLISALFFEAHNLQREGERQLSLFGEADTSKQRQLAATLDTIRARFGADAVTRARLAKREREEKAEGDPFA